MLRFLRFLSLPCCSGLLLLTTLGSAQEAAPLPAMEAPQVEIKVEKIVPEPAAVPGAVLKIQGGGQINVQGGNLIIINGVPVQPAAADGVANPSWLGVQMEVSGNLDLEDGEQPPTGVGLIGVVETGPAAKAGVKAFDRILKIDDKALKDEQDLRTTVRATKPGTKVTLHLLREGKELDVKVDLEAMPAQANLGFGLGFTTTTNSNKPQPVRFYNVPNLATETAPLDAVVLRDGNRLEGKLLSLTDTEATLKLATGPEVTLDLTAVQTIRLLGGVRPNSLPATLSLTDGSSLSGSELTLADGKFQFNFENQQAITLARAQVAEAGIAGPEALAAPVFYRGPTAEDGWRTATEQSWTFAENAWRNHSPKRAALSRKFLELPPALEFHFDYQNTLQPGWELVLFAQKGDNRSLNTPGLVRIEWNQDTLAVGNFDGMRFYNLQPTSARELPLVPDYRDPQHFHIYVDRLLGSLEVYRNERLLGSYELGPLSREDLPRAGRVFQFSAIDDSTFSHLQLRPWHGGTITLPTPNQEMDLLTAGAAAPLSGSLQTLSATEIILAGQPAMTRTLPLTLQLQPAAAPAAPALIAVETKPGSSFSATAVRLAEGQVTIATSFAGELRMPVEKLRGLEFRSATPLPAPAPGKLDVLTFRSGRVLTGNFAPPIAEGQLSWRLSAAKQPLRIALSELQSLLLAPRSEDAIPLTQVIRLHNGDWFPAEVLAVEPDSLTVRTSFDPQWKLPRRDLATIYSAPAAKLVADGASGRKRWRETLSAGGNSATFNDDDTTPQFVFNYVDGTYRSRTLNPNDGSQPGLALPITADANDGALIEFSVGSMQSYMVFTLMDAHGQGAFSIYASGDSLRVTRIRRALTLGNQQMDQFQFVIPEKIYSNPDVRYQMVLDRTNHCLHLAMNGQKLGTCKLKAEDPWTEITRAVFFPGTFGNKAFSIRNIWIAPWDGSFSTTAPADSASVALAFNNGDDAQGKLLSMNQSEAEIDTVAAGPLTLPLPRIRSMAFSGQSAENRAPFRIHLYDRGQLSGSALACTEAGAVLTTAAGPVTLPLGLVKEIIFAQE